ncbi:cytochrome C oxidase subunit II [Termitidicoccus mucosus]|uniref:cytochrome-c oxidase n=2 Tax=Termitidicoccus mucosus TaxID=1184151 RepID=A0A178IIS8_9BACT|nr:cytochrome C oxidase subunit II [Opitutaceae bacterium TSB47]
MLRRMRRAGSRFCPRLPAFPRAARAAALLALPVIFGGWLSGPQSTLDTEGPVAESQRHLFYTTLWVTVVIFVLVASVLAYATIKFRARTSADEHAEPPPQSHGNPLVELTLIGLSVAALVVIAIPTLRGIMYTYDVPEAERAGAYEVTATGFQWWFKFDYPAEEVELPNNAGRAPLTVANELVIPAGRAVRIDLRAYDVIHSFWVPKLAGKVDMIPNRGNHLWLKADRPGYYWGQCAEFCGESHAVMRFRVIALAADEFAAWLENQKHNARDTAAQSAGDNNDTAPAARVQFAAYEKIPRNTPGWSADFDADPLVNWRRQQEPRPAGSPPADAALIARGRALFTEKTCITCHTIRGHHIGGAPFAPDLTHVATRTTIAGGLLENTGANLHRWITDPDGVKPGNKMWRGVGGMSGYTVRDDDNTLDWRTHIAVTAPEAAALVAYLQSLK